VLITPDISCANDIRRREVYRETTKLLYKWLNRRSQRRSYQWAEFKQLLQRFPLPLPRVRVHLFYQSPNDCLGSRVR